MSNRPIRFALNRMVAPKLSLERFIALAQALGADAIELRNDLKGIEIEDGTPPEQVRSLCSAANLRILSINALYPFDLWNEERRQQAEKLAAYAKASGAEALVLCPLNDRNDPRSEIERARDLRTALSGLSVILRHYGVLGFIEPLGFEECSLRRKRQAVSAIEAIGARDVFRLVHDTFHHHLAGEQEFFPELTGLVHISGVEDGALPISSIRDAHRLLVGEADILGNAPQIKQLLSLGYQGHCSFEPFADAVHDLSDVQQPLAESMAHLRERVAV